jgi:ribonuclease P/MRP protein subunit RPP40
LRKLVTNFKYKIYVSTVAEDATNNNDSELILVQDNAFTVKIEYFSLPQGSVLGPLLFVIFINDLSNKIIKYSKLYADDTKIISIKKSFEDRDMLQKDIDTLVGWSNEWLIKFNEHNAH